MRQRLGYLDFTGNMDTCIAIRIAAKKNGIVTVQAGGGIVADSCRIMNIWKRKQGKTIATPSGVLRR